MSKIIRNVSLFSGCGGMDLGLKWAGVSTVAAIEIKDYACDTLRLNFPDTFVFGPPDFSGDVREVSGEDIKSAINYNAEIDIMSGGPPCQPFSIAAGQRWGKGDPRYRKQGSHDESRGNLLPEYVRLIQELHPKVFVLENVEGLLTWNKGNYLITSFEPILNEYKLSTPRIIQAADYGVPQLRERLILIGTRIPNKTPSVPVPIYLGGLFKNHFTVEDAFEDFPDSLPNHDLREHKPETLERYAKLKFGERDKLGRVDRLHPKKPSKTVISGGDKGGGRSHLHPYLSRTISPRECARLQTFPDDFLFCGKTSRQFTQIGNAVPPLLAYHLGRYIITSLLDEPGVPGMDLSLISHPIVSRMQYTQSRESRYAI